jgi:LCP family protein required for cell wall assembly
MNNKSASTKKGNSSSANGNRRLMKFLLAALGVIAVLVIVVYVTQALQRPLAPAMTVVTATPDTSAATAAITNTPIYIIVTSTPEAETPTAEPTTAPTATVESATTCNETGSYNILLIGVDENSGVWPPGAEMIRLVQVDFDDQTIKMVAFPRDLYVASSGLASIGMRSQTLGLVYYYGEQSVYGDRKTRAAAGASMLARTLLEDFNVESDQYIVVEADLIPNLVNKMGGIVVDIPYTFTGYDGVTFYAGNRLLYGDDVLNYVSAKPEYTESYRFQRQQAVIDAVLDRALSLDMVPRIPDLYSEVSNNLITDLSVSQISNIGCLVEKMDRSRMDSYNLQSSNFTWYTNYGTLIPNTAAIRDYLEDILE